MKLISVLLFMFFALTAKGAEFYSFVLNDCTYRSGLVVDIAEGHLDLLTIEGKHARFPISSVDSILIYNFVQNPLDKILLDENLRNSTRAVYLDDGDTPTLLGWPVKFVESLVMFYDLKGKVHVYEMNQILKIRPASQIELKAYTPESVKPITINPLSFSLKCQTADDAKTPSARPTRVLSDQIKIKQALQEFEKGFLSLKAYEERTYLYAKPLLFEQKSRLGLIFKSPEIDPVIPFPIYFQWSTGKPYHFQSFTQVGGTFNEFLPIVDPLFGVRSEMKAHFFHAHFAGNIVALPAGQSYFDTIGSFIKTTGEEKFFTTINYMALMGGDYGPYSLSAGYFFPAFSIGVKESFREILASQTTFAFRGIFTKNKMRIRAIYSPLFYSSASPDQTNLIAREKGDYTEITSFDFSGNFLRAGIDYDVLDDTKASAEILYLAANYDETMQSGQENKFKFSQNILSLKVRKDFADLVALNAFGHYVMRSYDYSFPEKTDNKNVNQFKYGGSFEFVF